MRKSFKVPISQARGIWLQWYSSAANSSKHQQTQFLPYLASPGGLNLLKRPEFRTIHLEPHLTGVCTNDRARKRADQAGRGTGGRGTLQGPYKQSCRRARRSPGDNQHVFRCPLIPVQMFFSLCRPHCSRNELWMSEAERRMAYACLHRGWTVYQQVRAGQQLEINILVANILSVIANRGLADRCVACSDKWTRILKLAASLVFLSIP